ncbi:hypothetical protein [uncultured Chryseobacterium sp.]|uniref:hypothetical protein n=1 Tax=Chryseobacterium sp. sg2396 TaxID=3276280 RepID=UPI00258474DA|nr:hypothetical protein [uncultured Chryseobacterium sp.]
MKIKIPELNVFSEMKSRVENLISDKRKKYVQPDVIFKDDNKSESALAIIDVKQYKKTNRSNFEAAIRDYCKAFENANIFLVNYVW